MPNVFNNERFVTDGYNVVYEMPNFPEGVLFQNSILNA